VGHIFWGCVCRGTDTRITGFTMDGNCEVWLVGCGPRRIGNSVPNRREGILEEAYGCNGNGLILGSVLEESALQSAR